MKKTSKKGAARKTARPAARLSQKKKPAAKRSPAKSSPAKPKPKTKTKTRTMRPGGEPRTVPLHELPGAQQTMRSSPAESPAEMARAGLDAFDAGDLGHARRKLLELVEHFDGKKK